MKKSYLMIALILLAGCSSPAEETAAPTVGEKTGTALPTYTMFPLSPSPTLESTLATSEKVRLEEDFSDEESCFSLLNEPDWKTEIKEGVYRIEINSPIFNVRPPCETLVIGDFIMDVDVELLQTPESGVNYSFGLAFRINGVEHYAFIIINMQEYCVFHLGEDEYTYLTDSTDLNVRCRVKIPQSAIKEGTQHMRVVAVGDRMDLYLNGELLAVVRDSRLQAGWVGFTAATAGDGTLIVEFDNLVVTDP